MGDNLWRRSLYTYWKRAAPPPSMLTFDVPTREYCVTNRISTNTPLQALVLWNDEQFVEAARATATRILTNSTGDRDAIVELYRLCTGETPSPRIARSLLDAVRAYRERYEASPEEAKMLLEVGDSPTSTDLPAPELAAWTMLANAILASEPVIVKD